MLDPKHQYSRGRNTGDIAHKLKRPLYELNIMEYHDIYSNYTMMKLIYSKLDTNIILKYFKIYMWGII